MRQRAVTVWSDSVCRSRSIAASAPTAKQVLLPPNPRSNHPNPPPGLIVPKKVPPRFAGQARLERRSGPLRSGSGQDTGVRGSPDPWATGAGRAGNPGGTAHARVGPLARRGFQAPRRFGGRGVQVIGPCAPGGWHRTQDREERGSPAGHGIQGGPRQGHSAVKGDGGDPRRWTAAQTRHFWTTRSGELQGSGWTRSRSPAPCRWWRHGIPRVTQGGTGPSAIMIGERSGTAGSATRGSPL